MPSWQSCAAWVKECYRPAGAWKSLDMMVKGKPLSLAACMLQIKRPRDCLPGRRVGKHGVGLSRSRSSRESM